MSNIERRYAYLDEGTFPEEGEKGVTYLTLYSSNAGNIYDGWVYDPDNKVEESFTERTYGYRNPDYPQYCWDDEVVVDLSNAQNRQESSEYIQGRITSFNTNVSDRPIILQDIDITGLTEEERENLATTVLFSAIPLVQDAYIQANVEVQCKCNLSQDNTSGEMRVEAFYILNDESDRTMRPNPVHTFTVSSANERHTLPWLYWNPALRHEDHNYIGVKLICTGGTAEIGISDDPDYGDAMITLASAGLTGDHIDSGKPVYLEIFGKEEVVGGYELDINDYTVLCTYDTGEIYDVTHMCSFTPAMGTEITEAITTLTAEYMGLHASMTIRLGMVESIELIGVDTFHDELRLKMSDFTVLAYLDTGDIAEVTAECTFNPAMGTVINTDTTLTATYEPYWMPGSSFTSSMEIEKIGELVLRSGRSDGQGLIYSLYDDGPNTPAYIEITGDSLVYPSGTPGYGDCYYDRLEIPSEIASEMQSRGTRYFNLEWKATGPVGGVILDALFSGGGGGYTSNMINFEDVHIKPHWKTIPSGYLEEFNPIYLSFSGNETITSEKLSFLKNIEYDIVDDVLPRIVSSAHSNGKWSSAFKGCKQIENLDFLVNIDATYVTSIDQLFYGDEALEDISGIKDWNVTNIESSYGLFEGCTSLESAGDLYKWYMPFNKSAKRMFAYSGLTTCVGLGNIKIGERTYASQGGTTFESMFEGCEGIERLNGLYKLVHNKVLSTKRMFYGCVNLSDISAASDWNMSNNENVEYMFGQDESLEDISPMRNWDMSEVIEMGGMLRNTHVNNEGYINGWNVGNVQHFQDMFSASYDDLGSWTGSNLTWSDYASSMTFEKLFFPNPQQQGRLSMVHLSELDDPEHRIEYYVSSGNMYSGRDMVMVRRDISSAVIGISPIHTLPSFYLGIYMTKLRDYFNVT